MTEVRFGSVYGQAYLGLELKTIQELAQALETNTHVRTLDISEYPLIPEAWQAIAEALGKNTSIQNIKLASSDITEVSINAILEAINFNVNTNVITLDLCNNKMSINSIKYLEKLLAENKTVHTLKLERCEIYKNGAVALAKGLKLNSTLHTLQLDGCRIDNDGAIALAEAIAENSTLLKLSLLRNGIGTTGGRAIFNSLQSNKTLTTLVFHDDKLDTDILTDVIRTLKVNPTLELLSLGSNIIRSAPSDKDFITKLLDAASNSNGSLRELRLEGMSRDDSIKIAKALNKPGLFEQSLKHLSTAARISAQIEEGVSIEDIQNDLKSLRESFQNAPRFDIDLKTQHIERAKILQFLEKVVSESNLKIMQIVYSGYVMEPLLQIIKLNDFSSGFKIAKIAEEQGKKFDKTFIEELFFIPVPDSKEDSEPFQNLCKIIIKNTPDLAIDNELLCKVAMHYALTNDVLLQYIMEEKMTEEVVINAISQALEDLAHFPEYRKKVKLFSDWALKYYDVELNIAQSFDQSKEYKEMLDLVCALKKLHANSKWFKDDYSKALGVLPCTEHLESEIESISQERVLPSVLEVMGDADGLTNLL